MIARGRGLKPDRVCHADLRGGQIIAADDETVTIRLHLEAHMIGTREIPRETWPAAVGITIGAPVVVRVSGTAADHYVVVEVQAGRFAGVAGPGRDEAGAVARGEFWPAAIPYPAGDEFWPW